MTIQTLGLPLVNDEEWDDTAVRKVLHTFAYGGHATDAQISAWADMPPDQAIAEMLTFEEHNLLLSPVTGTNYDQLDKPKIVRSAWLTISTYCLLVKL